jgi:hypothetical protein
VLFSFGERPRARRHGQSRRRPRPRGRPGASGRAWSDSIAGNHRRRRPLSWAGCGVASAPTRLGSADHRRSVPAVPDAGRGGRTTSGERLRRWNAPTNATACSTSSRATVASARPRAAGAACGRRLPAGGRVPRATSRAPTARSSSCSAGGRRTVTGRPARRAPRRGTPGAADTDPTGARRARRTRLQAHPRSARRDRPRRARRLEQRSGEVVRIVRLDLPPWLVRALANSIDSVLCNSVCRAMGGWPTDRGSTGGRWAGSPGPTTSGCPHTLPGPSYRPNLTELDETAACRTRGAIPHNGNCDLALGTTDVPYGWPMFIKGFLPARSGPTCVSLVLQTGKVARHRTARRARRFWPSWCADGYLRRSRRPACEAAPTTSGTFRACSPHRDALSRASTDGEAISRRADTTTPRVPRCGSTALGPARLVAPRRATTRSSPRRWPATGRARPGSPVVPHGARAHLEHQQRVLVDAAVAATRGRYRALPARQATSTARR